MSGAPMINATQHINSSGGYLGEAGTTGTGQLGVTWGTSQVILEADGSVPDVSSTRSGWILSTEKTNASKLLQMISSSFRFGNMNVEQTPTGLQTFEPGTDGKRAWVNNDKRMTFGAYLPELSPAKCSYNPECTTEKRFSTPKKASAISDAIDLYRKLGVDVNAFVWNAQVETQDKNVRVIGTLQVENHALPFLLVTDVSSFGIYSVNGFAASVTEIKGYELVGARTAAKRSQDPAWSSLGPTNLWQPTARSTTGEVPIDVDFSALFAGKTAGKIGKYQGRPMLSTPVKRVSVSNPVQGLGLYYLPSGDAILLPTWEFDGSDDARWAMPAIADTYVNFTP